MHAFQTLQQLSRLSRTDPLPATLGGFTLEPPTRTPLPDGGERVATAIANPTDDMGIPLGSWLLRLLPVSAAGGARLPITLDYNADDTFREMRVDLLRFELIADPDDLVAADLHTEPHTHLTPTVSPGGQPIPVRILGPGMTVILSGTELSGLDVDFSGAEGSSEPDFPSLRCEPPHFLVGGRDSELGVACDEVLLDLSPEESPAAVGAVLGAGGPWRGLLLKELGIFIGDGTEVGTWSGMAMMRDFFLDFDTKEISGTFMAELVHYALENDPQVQVAIFFEGADGDEVLAEDEGDASIPAPPAGRDFVRVRLEARPNWDSAGFRIDWTPPPGVTVEEPGRLGQLNLGWVRVPADGASYGFTVRITDHRVPDQSETRQVAVAERVPETGPSPLAVTFDGILEDAGFAPGERPTNRLHVGLAPGQDMTLTARVRGGSGSADAVLTLPAGYSTGDPLSQSVSTPGNASWRVTAPSPGTLPAHDVFVLDVTDGGTTIQRRLRASIEEPAPDGHRDFEMVSYTDWRADPGIGLARIRLREGLDFGAIEWRLESEDVPDGVDPFSDPGWDAPFDGGAYTHSEDLVLSNSAGTVRPFLHTPRRLWRLTGRVPAAPAATPTRAPLVAGEPADSAAMRDPKVTGFLALGVGDPGPVRLQLEDGTPTPGILFHYDCALVQPDASDPALPPPCRGEVVGPEDDSVRLTHDETLDEQARGFAALFQAIEAYDAEIQELALFGAASIEGPRDYNLDLSERRVNAAGAALLAPPSDLVSRMAALPAPDAYSFTPGGTAATRLAALDAAGAIVTESFGEEHAHSSIDPRDRRVFAIIKLTPAAATEGIVHREYFVTLPGAIPPAETPSTPLRQLQDHPFRHSVFRLIHVELELLRSEFVRFQLRLKLDLEAFDENDELPGGPLNELDGVTTFFLELRRNPAPAPGEPRWSWELVALADPGDVDGLLLLKKPEDATTVDVLGPPGVTVPALTALSGGRVGITAFVTAVSVGALLSELDLLDVRTLVWRGIRFKLLHGNVRRPTLSFAVDYTVKYHIDADLEEMIGLPIRLVTQRPIEISFRNVGVEVRDLENVEFFYDPADGFQLDVNDPGVFRLGDGLGRLLGVRRFRSGAGSPLWFEVELFLNLDTGIFSIDTLRIRVSLEPEQLFEPDASGEVTLGEDSIELGDFSVSLNKLGVTVDVPGTLEGRGELGFSKAGPATVVEGQVDLGLVPIDLRIYGGLKLYSADELRALYAHLGVEFAPGILLGSTGAAIYGFFGLIGVNMGRSLPEPLPWFKGPPVGVTDVDKWVPDRGHWAFGVGTVIGTAYDNGFSFNTKGAFLLEVPGPVFTLATESRFIQAKPPVGDAATGDIVSIVMLDFENDLLLIGIDFTFEKPRLIEFRVPTEVFFNLADAGDWHIRFGQWSPESKRITVRLFDMFDAWGYLVLEGSADDAPIPMDLHGVALAAGARIEIFWGSRSVGVYLEAFVEVHVGLQIQPLLLQGLLAVGGELHLGPFVLGASGELNVMAPDPFVVRGKICGKLKLFLFTVKGCAKFTVGDGSASLPAPPNPFKELVPIDRMTSAGVEDTNAVPLNGVLHLVFDQDMIDRRTPPGADLATGSLRNQVSDDLYYEYYVNDVRIVRASDGTPVSDVASAWGAYSLPDASPEDADSARALRLLDWMPNSHARALDFASGYGETLRRLILRLCDPTPPPERGCATFDEEPLGIASVWQLNEGDLAPVMVISSQSDGLGGEFVGGALGLSVTRVVSLVPVAYPDRAPLRHCLRLAAGGRLERQRPSLESFFPHVVSAAPAAGAEGAGAALPPVMALDEELLGRLDERIARVFDALEPAPVEADEIELPDLGERLAENPLFRAEAVTARPAGALPLTVAGTLPFRPAPETCAPSAAERFGDVLIRAADAARAHRETAAAELTPGVRQARISTHYQTLLWLSGLLFVRLPDLVEAEATFVLHEKLTGMGEAVFLDASFHAITPVVELRSLPVVPGSVGTGAFQHHVARRLSFGPPEDDAESPLRAAWLVINPPERIYLRDRDSYAYLNQICGVTYGAWRRWRDRVGNKELTIERLEEEGLLVGGVPAASSHALLDPDTDYRVEGELEWARFRDASTASDDGTDAYATAQTFGTFRTAADSPAEIRRYVLDHDPPDFEQPHYYEDPMRIRFASDVIDRLFAKFGEQLVARAKADTGTHVLNQPMSDGATREFFPYGDFEVRVHAALEELNETCADGDWDQLFPKLVYTFDPLTPNTGYTVTLISRPLGEPTGIDPADWNATLQSDFEAGRAVFRFDMRTSRWADFSAHVAAYREQPVGDVFGDDQAALDTALGALAADRSDEAVDALSLALFGGPLAVPPAPQVTRVWVPTGLPPDPFSTPPYRCRGLLLDGPEPLLKVWGDGTERTQIDAARVPTSDGAILIPGTPLPGLRVVAGARGARFYLMFDPDPTDPPPFVEVQLRYPAAPGATPALQRLVIPVGDTPGSFD